MSAIITITNQKGGVGKTTTSSALMDGLRSRGARVLGVDLDPQGSLGFCLGLDIEHCATIYDALKGSAPIRDVIMHSECGDILPSNILLSAAELEFNRPGREFLLKNCLAEVEEDYDYIIIDTPPALNVLPCGTYTAVEGQECEVLRIVQAMFGSLTKVMSNFRPCQMNCCNDGETYKNLQEVQRLAGLPVTGILDRSTWAYMVQLYQALVTRS